MTGKLKGGHNPYTHGCYKNYQFLLCGPSWPRYLCFYFCVIFCWLV